MTAEEGRASSHRFFADLFRPNADCVFNRKNKNFTVADFAGFGRAHHYGDGFFHHVVCEHDFNFHLGQKINGVFAAAINFGVPFLPAKAFYLRHCHALDAEFGQGLFHFLEFEGLNDRFEFFHCG